MQAVYEKLAILDEYLGRSLLDGRVWSAFARSIMAYRTWDDDRVRAINNNHWSVASPCITRQWRKPPKLRRRQIVQKTILTTCLETPKDIVTKSGKNPRTEQSSTITQIFTPIGARYLSPDKKYVFFLIGDSWGLLSFAVDFFKAPVELFLSSNGRITLRYRFQDMRFLEGQNFGFCGSLGGTAHKRGEATYGTDVQNFTRIGRRDICRRRKKQVTANLISDKTHTVGLLAFVG